MLKLIFTVTLALIINFCNNLFSQKYYLYLDTTYTVPEVPHWPNQPTSFVEIYSKYNIWKVIYNYRLPKHINIPALIEKDEYILFHADAAGGTCNDGSIFFDGSTFFYQIKLVPSVNDEIVFLQIRISPPSPNIVPILERKCNSSAFNLSIVDDLYDEENYLFEYSIDSINYYEFWTGAPPAEFNPSILGILNSKTKVYFRARTLAVYGANFENSPFGETIIVDILPPPPTSSISQTHSSCLNNPTGEIDFNITYSPVPTNKYSAWWTNPSNPDQWSDEKPFIGNHCSFSNIAPGNYILHVKYDSAAITGCTYSVPFTINSFPDLIYTNPEITNPTCPNYSDGRIGLTITTGAGEYSITNGADVVLGQTSASFTGLVAGNYPVTIADRCTTKSETLILTAPNPVTLGVNSTFSPDCAVPANGGINLSASGGTGSAFDYYIYSGNTLDPLKLTDSIINASGMVTWEKAQQGVYLVNLRDHSLPNCPGVTLPASVQGFAQLALSPSNITNVACFGDSTGKILASATGGSNNYLYTLRNTHNGSIWQNDPQGLFESLPAGAYNLTVRNNNTCLDSVVIPATITSNPKINIPLNKTDVTCSNKTDASLALNLSVPDYSWIWEMRSVNNWETMGNNNITVSDLDSGLYRVRITQNATNCKTDSFVLISKPAPLVFDSLRFMEAKCFGDSNYFTMYSSGGNAGHLYQFNRNDAGWENYTSNTNLPDGNYRIRVTDIKLCTFEDTALFRLTTPQAPLTFTQTFSDYNGTNISCFGNNDGWASIGASGGNGGHYSGYIYVLNDTLAQDSSLFNNLKAGTYIVSVFDARGCRVEKSFEFTQPLSEIKLFIDSVANVKCAEDANGVVQLKAQGNDGPFLYSCNNGAFSSSNVFFNLPVGDYRFYTRDNKGCTQYIDTSVVSLLPKMVFGGEIKHVKCKGDSTGSIRVLMSGGGGGYSYYWKELGAASQFVSSLPQGFYSVRVTDSVGCTQSVKYLITEPLYALGQDIVTKPVCAGTTQGVIKSFGKGGTPPYKWTLNNTTLDGKSVNFNVAPGQYTVFLSDSNNCVDTKKVTIDVRNQMPDINFMVATSRYELDTLVIKDVSMPKPDSIYWVFSPEAIVVDKGDSGARVKYPMFGEYPVAMTGWFAGCDYTIDKTLTIEPIKDYKPPKNLGVTGFEKVILKPNPNNGNFTVDFALYSTERVLIKVVDMYSKIVYQQNVAPTTGYEHTISISQSPPGTYLLVMVSETDSRSVRFIISK